MSDATDEVVTAARVLDEMNFALTREPVRIEISRSGTFGAYGSEEPLEFEVTQHLDAANHRGRREAG